MSKKFLQASVSLANTKPRLRARRDWVRYITDSLRLALKMDGFMDHHRQSLRLAGYDYSQAGAYFVTIVTWQRICLFGTIADGQFLVTDFGQIAAFEWQKLGTRFPFATFDTFIVMPNHIHGVVVIESQVESGSQATHSPDRLLPHSLGSIIGAYKSTTARLINGLRKTANAPVWLRNYYEHVIRDEAEWTRIYEYITDNPRRWAEDEENPTRY